MSHSSPKFRIFAGTFLPEMGNLGKLQTQHSKKRLKMFGELLKLSYICSKEYNQTTQAIWNK